MKINVKKLPAAAAAAVLLAAAPAQEAADTFLGEFVNRAWTAADGLPGNTITDIMQDDTGYLYAGTYDGLVRFDGVEFLTINHNLDPKYRFVSARSLFQDRAGNIWVGANDEGVACIHKNGAVQMYTAADGLPNNSVRDIEEDQEGNVWVGTAAGVAVIAPDGSVSRPAGLERYDADDLMVNRLYCDTAGRIWLTSMERNGIYRYIDGRFERFGGLKTVADPVVSYVTQDADMAFWFGVSPHYAVRLSGTEEAVYDLGHGQQQGTQIKCIYQDRKGNMWFALDNGVAVIHNGATSCYNQELGLTDNNVNVVTEDREGNIWFGTDRGGLEKLTLSKFKTIPMPTTVNAIADDREHGLAWLGCDKGLYCYSYVASRFVENELTRLCADTRVRHVALAANGDLLVSTYERHGQLRLGRDGSVTSWLPESGLSGSKVRVALESSAGDLYVGTTTGLSVIDRRTGLVSAVYTREQGLPNDYIMCLYEDDGGRVWGGTDGGGIFVLEGGRVTRTYTTEDGLAGNVVFKISQLRKGEIWVCTGTGVSRLKDGRFFTFSTANGLGTDSVFQLIPDYTGTVWLTSNRGIASVKLAQLEAVADGEEQAVQAKYFGRSDGLRSGGITSTSLSMKDNIGRVWFTLIDGFALYDPVKVTNKTVPAVQLQEITVDTETSRYDGTPVIVPPDGKRVSIKFTGLSFVSSEQVQFRYRLEGFDADYSGWSAARSVSYTNLRPGTYRFSVQAENSDEIASPLSPRLVIIKRAYLWQHWWFWLLLVLLAAGTVALILLNRWRRMRKYQAKLEHEVEVQTAELAQKNRDLQLANEKSEKLLLNILPRDIARELTERPDEVIAKSYPNACVLFADIVGFTKLSDSLSAREVVNILNSMFSTFDMRLNEAGIEKIKTIGDAYMAACGLTEEAANDGAVRMVALARGLMHDLEEFNRTSRVQLGMRIGINSGNLVAGVIGRTKFIYDVWGDTVNVASRMESTGIPNRIHVTESTYQQARDTFAFEGPVELEVKGKGIMQTYFLAEY